MKADQRPGGAVPGSFTVLRLIAALLVFFSHAYVLRTGHEWLIPLVNDSMGHTGVMMFFAMSGYLVGLSAERSDPIAFLASRFLRIQPGLTVATLVVIVGLFPFSGMTASAYAQHDLTRDFLASALIWMIPTQNMLPGLFTSLPHHAANGSLWTLPYEVFCYGALLGVSLLGRTAIRRTAWAVQLLFLWAALSHGANRFSLAGLTYYDSYEFFTFIPIFAIGVLLCGSSRAQHRSVMLACLVAVILTWRGGPGRLIAWEAFLALATVYLGRYADLDAWLPRNADISYGIYIYAYPSTQLSLLLIGTAADQALISGGMALALTLVLATLSWRLVEKPSLALKPRLAAWLRRWPSAP